MPNKAASIPTTIIIVVISEKSMSVSEIIF
jgi:hypothetical protein